MNPSSSDGTIVVPDTLCVPAPGLGKEERMNEPINQDPLTFSPMLRPGDIHELIIGVVADNFHDLKSLEGGTVYS